MKKLIAVATIAFVLGVWVGATPTIIINVGPVEATQVADNEDSSCEPETEEDDSDSEYALARIAPYSLSSMNLRARPIAVSSSALQPKRHFVSH